MVSLLGIVIIVLGRYIVFAHMGTGILGDSNPGVDGIWAMVMVKTPSERPSSPYARILYDSYILPL